MTIAFVQVLGNNHYQASDGVYSPSGTVTSGNIIVGYIYFDSAVTLSSLSCNRCDSITLLHNSVQAWSNNDTRAALFYGVLTSGGSITLTPTFSGTLVDNNGVTFHEYSGVDTTTPVEASNMTMRSALGTGTDAYTSGGFTPTSNNCMIVGFVVSMADNVTYYYTPGTYFTGRNTSWSNDLRVFSEDRILATASEVNATYTNSPGWLVGAIGGVALKPAAGSPTALPRRFLDGPFYGSLRGSIQ